MSAGIELYTIKPTERHFLKSEDIVKFSIAYENYSQQFATVNSGLERNQRVKKVRYKACIAPELLPSFTEMNEFENVETVTELTDEMVEKWVKNARRCQADEQPEQVNDALSRVRFTYDSADPKGACVDVFTRVATELRRNRAQEVIKSNTKVLIEMLIKNLEPSILRTRIFRNFKYLPEDQRRDYKLFRADTVKIAI